MDHSKPVILCVDDDPVNTALLEVILSPHGDDVLVAHSGFDALRLILYCNQDDIKTLVYI